MAYYMIDDEGKLNQDPSMAEVTEFYSILADSLADAINSDITGELEKELPGFIIRSYEVLMAEQIRATYSDSAIQNTYELREFFNEQDQRMKELITNLAERKKWGLEVLQKADKLRTSMLVAKLDVEVSDLQDTKLKR